MHGRRINADKEAGTARQFRERFQGEPPRKTQRLRPGLGKDCIDQRRFILGRRRCDHHPLPTLLQQID